MKSAEIVPFYGEVADRCRERRRVALTAADWFWLSTAVFWPLSIAVSATMALSTILLGEGRRP